MSDHHRKQLVEPGGGPCHQCGYDVMMDPEDGTPKLCVRCGATPREAHYEECRCSECHPFRVGSIAEQEWNQGHRPGNEPTPPPRPRQVLPPAPERVNGRLPGDEDILAARRSPLAS